MSEAGSTPLTRPGWPRPAASIAVFKGDRLLLVERGKGPVRGIWSLPGGHIEPGETASGAALRELGEETGVEAELVGLAGVHDVLIRSAGGALTAHYVLCVYGGRWRAGEPRAGSDSAAARFLTPDEIQALTLTNGLEPIIAKARLLVRGEDQ